MHFLLSNDDGYQSPGISALAEALDDLGRVTVVAPDRDCSGASNSLTLDSPLYVKQDERGFYYVNGTPSDCVHLAITGLLSDEEPNMVISGINSGANLGDDVLYSGTVAAAMEGRFLGCPAIAFSLAGDGPTDYSSSVLVAKKIVQSLIEKPLDDILLNINIPDINHEQIQGFKITRLGNRHKSEPAMETFDPKGRKVYWVGPVGAEQDAGEGTDFHAIRTKHISITPIQIDLTRHQSLSTLSKWAEILN
ncbi:MAG: 5'/3'-nucleotidase SurE [Legionellales bacterium]|mgnify:FL=1|jgi:5'-nucleotidase|nr:5'/3'-nucleotidase SurE [Legionellales bacterium]|tara:strand:+ start:106 stop:855 length:750 start_codon:yes stop_codon:yes gene_type:complete